MKHLLATTTILALSAGFAAAEVTLSGDARMGIIGGDGVDTAFTSRARVKFSMSGETDGGIAFGASFRAHNAASAASGTAGDVYISGAFGKLSMGDVDGAAAAAVGQASGVGLTGLGDFNEIAYLTGNEDPTALYEYSTGSFAGYISGNTTGDYAVGAAYTAGSFKFSAGYESVDDGSDMTGSSWGSGGKMDFSNFFGNGATQVVVGADATFGAVTAKLRFARYDEDNYDGTMDQTSLSVDYAMDALTVTAYVGTLAGGENYSGDDASFYGVGAAYDLGGGASVVGGYSNQDYDDYNPSLSGSRFDLGLSFSF